VLDKLGVTASSPVPPIIDRSPPPLRGGMPDNNRGPTPFCRAAPGSRIRESSPVSLRGGWRLPSSTSEASDVERCHEEFAVFRRLLAVKLCRAQCVLGVAALGLLVATPAIARPAGPAGMPRLQLRAADSRRAKSALLRRSDLISTFRVDPHGSGVPIPRCADFPGDRSSITITGLAKSSFTDGTDVMASSSIVFKSYGDLDRYWARTVRPRFATCNAEAYASTRSAGVKMKTLMARQIRIGATGAERAAAFRTITRVWFGGHSPVDWYQTVVFLRQDRGLAAIKIGYANQPCNCQTGLARRLAGRLIEASHR
jgi:hypothetical protein